ncbi:MAG: hypothetical protein H0U28_02585 [Nocardioidaceae bacterium]|nr:hypothetical protein [Nocardioidaceae bacterium]
MAFTQLGKTRKDLEKRISEATPLYAVVGAGDLAVQKIRDARAELSARAATPEHLMTLPAKARAVLGDAVASAESRYDDLAGRGKHLVTRVRNQEATVDLEKQAKTTASRAKATSTSAKKTAATAKESAAATEKPATTTKRSAKATTTSAKKTASAAKKAAVDGVDKVGH